MQCFHAGKYGSDDSLQERKRSTQVSDCKAVMKSGVVLLEKPNPHAQSLSKPFHCYTRMSVRGLPPSANPARSQHQKLSRSGCETVQESHLHRSYIPRRSEINIESPLHQSVELNPLRGPTGSTPIRWSII